jgi:hypothetical protein
MKGLWKALRKVLMVEIIKPSRSMKMENSIYMSNSDMYVLIEVNLDDVMKTEPMNMDGILNYVLNKYAEQPIKYFNETQRLKVVHLKSGIIKNVNLVLEF